MSTPTLFDNEVIYCIENRDEGKHNFIYEENFGVTCEFCFLPHSKANFKPIIKDVNGKFKFIEYSEQTKKYFFEVDQN